MKKTKRTSATTTKTTNIMGNFDFTHKGFAIAHAEKKSKGFFARFSKKRIDEYGNKLLLEEDFDY